MTSYEVNYKTLSENCAYSANSSVLTFVVTAGRPPSVMSFWIFLLSFLHLFGIPSLFANAAPISYADGLVTFAELETPSEGGLFVDFDVQELTKRSFFPTLGHNGKCEHGKGDCFLEVPPLPESLASPASPASFPPHLPPSQLAPLPFSNVAFENNTSSLDLPPPPNP